MFDAGKLPDEKRRLLMKENKTGKNKKMTLIAILLLIAAAVVIAMMSGAKGKSEMAGKIRIGSLKGPTSIGLLSLIEKAEAGDAEGDYEFQMATAADELLPLM